MTTLYLDDAIEFNMDVLEALECIDDFVCYMPSWPTIKFLLLQLFPNSNNSSLKDKKTTKREIADHYDRGNDFFNAFLGPRMIYTSAVFETAEDTLETAQDNKMRKVSGRAERMGGVVLVNKVCIMAPRLRRIVVVPQSDSFGFFAPCIRFARRSGSRRATASLISVAAGEPLSGTLIGTSRLAPPASL